MRGPSPLWHFSATSPAHRSQKCDHTVHVFSHIQLLLCSLFSAVAFTLAADPRPVCGGNSPAGVLPQRESCLHKALRSSNLGIFYDVYQKTFPYIYTREYCSAIKNNELNMYQMAWSKSQEGLLSEKSKLQENTDCMMPLQRWHAGILCVSVLAGGVCAGLGAGGELGQTHLQPRWVV